MSTKPRSKSTDSLVLQRLPKILKHSNLRWSVGLGVVAFALLALLHLPKRHGETRIVELSGALLAFTSMGFAVSLTAVALILAMPMGRMTALLVVNTRNATPVQVFETSTGALEVAGGGQAIQDASKNATAYLDLIAVFLITALANVISSIAVVVWSIVAGGDDLLSSHTLENLFLVAIVTATVSYSALQMLTAVKTIYQVAVLIQAVMRETLRKTSNEHNGQETRPDGAGES